MIYAVIDTNVFISALLSKNEDSATVKIFNAIVGGIITPLYHKDIIEEYSDVLHRKKFKFSEEKIMNVLNMIEKYGVEIFPKPTGEILIDMDDLIFYEVAMETRDDDSYLVTGNQKHYPIKDFIVTPAEMIEIIKRYTI
ncbi:MULTISPECIES: putative toxin-antitoxin system toxin component, PIN family [unclassified Butyrivibrio]|jgi:putative PIN family toxin of toxin-antitoxin system|uniref:putative toxin-antitoxin system toxin component, PIN family n=1 Tax=unclassified Butyrivibrio TaxID=2639466 RepID=UPI00047CAC0B|nr:MULTISPECIES: putative toxin-antitoxin system toxin component, PIN family [unclassified Butyrivibrio]